MIEGQEEIRIRQGIRLHPRRRFHRRGRHDAKTPACANHVLGLKPARTRLSRNENYDWGQTSGGVKMLVKYFEEIAKLR